MNDFIIMTDSCCDLPAQLADKLELTILPLSFTINGKEHYNYLDGRDISSSHFYRLLREGTQCTTSAANTNAFLSAMEPVLKKGKDILCICFSSALSTTCASAQMAAKELVLKYPNNKIYIVDSLSASLGQGMLTYYAVQQKRSGKTIEQVYQWMEQNKLHLCHWFTVNDLYFLKKGGRVSASTALLGTLLNIKPVMHMDNDGHLILKGKVRGRKASLDALVNKAGELGIDLASQTVFISHGDCVEDAEYVRDQMKEKYGVSDFLINYVDCVIGAHSGPGTVALFFMGKER